MFYTNPNLNDLRFSNYPTNKRSNQIKMSIILPKITQKIKINNIFLIIFLICLINSFWCISLGWNNPLLDEQAFRQTQTAISAYYLLKGGSWLNYETPVLGAPWSIPFEFPLYQWLVAITVKIFATPLDQTGRLVSAIFFYLSLIPSYIILAGLEVPKHYRWMFLSLFLASPLYLFWSRTFMIESTALFFGLAYLAAVIYYFRKNKLKLAIIATIFGILGALVKITTFLGFLIAAFLLTIFHWYKKEKSKVELINNLVIPFIAFALLPYLAIWNWTHFADSQKLLNPIAANFITSKDLTTWNFGTLEQKLSFKVWKGILGRSLYDLWGSQKIIFSFLVLLPIFSRRKKIYLASVFLFIIIMGIFTNLHLLHNYYQYSNGVFLIAAVGFGLLGLMEKKGNWKILGCSLLVIVLIFQFQSYQNTQMKIVQTTDKVLLETAAIIQKYTNVNDVLLIYGFNWSSALPYYSERRALMLSSENITLPNQTKMKAAFKELAEYKLGAMLVCQNARTLNPQTIAKLLKNYNFQKEVVYSNAYCDIHLPTHPDEKNIN